MSGGTVTLRLGLHTALREAAAGQRQLSVQLAAPADVRGLLAELERTHPGLRRRLADEQGTLRRHVNLYRGNDNVRDLDGLDTGLADGDELIVLPAISGG